MRKESYDEGKTVSEVRELLKAKSTRSAWEKGVREYALEILENVAGNEGDDYVLHGSPADKKLWLYGASDWREYSEGGVALIRDREIAERLCSPSELKKVDGGEKEPNSRESWIDVQTRALHQAERMILDVINVGRKGRKAQEKNYTMAVLVHKSGGGFDLIDYDTREIVSRDFVAFEADGEVDWYLAEEKANDIGYTLSAYKSLFGVLPDTEWVHPSKIEGG